MSVLAINGINASPYSLRGLTQSLTLIEASQQMRRTVNGSLIDISAPQFRKYRSTITCADQLPPAFDPVYPGQSVTVDCVSELSYLTGGSPSRTVVPASSRVDGAYTFYRPRLTMRVVGFGYDTDEYGATVSWTLELEEI